MGKKLLSMLLTVAITLTASCALAASPAWRRVAGKNESILAASTDGTRFLLGEASPSEFVKGMALKLRILDEAANESRALFFADNPYLELLAHGLLQKNVPDDEKRTAIIEKQGGAAAMVMRHGWLRLPTAVGACSDYMLIMSAATPCYARVDTRTGETLILNASAASMSADGSVLYRDRETRGFYLLKPDRTEAEAYPLQIGYLIAPSSMHLLSDGGVWLIECVARAEQPEVEGKRVIVRDVSFVRYGADGRELRRVAVGGFDLRAGAPDTLYYSEQTGVGVAYSPQYASRSPMWTFGEDDETAKALMPKSLTPPALYRAERGEVVDELGYALADVRVMAPLGISADGARLLLYDMGSAYSLALDLQTLIADDLITDAQLEALYSELDARLNYGLHMTMLWWNGGDLLCGRANPEGCTLEIPYTQTFGK